MSRSRRWFKYVVWFGIVLNWAFAVFVLFVNPARLLDSLGLGPVNNTIWMVNYSVLLRDLELLLHPGGSRSVQVSRQRVAADRGPAHSGLDLLRRRRHGVHAARLSRPRHG